MRCITPMVRYYDKAASDYKEKYNLKDMKVFQQIVPRSQVFDQLSQNNNYLSQIQNKNYELKKQGSNMRYELIPCRNCFACNLNYSAEWATKLTWECQESEHNYFITLTYDEEHLPIYETFKYIDEDQQETIYKNDGTWTGTLEPEHVNTFINSLRKYMKREKNHTGIKYYYCGEYGNESKTGMGYRPHYHIILMNCPLDISQFYDWHLDNKHKKLHWKSKELNHYWDKGLVDVAEVEWNNCAYVARYCMKKLKVRDKYTVQNYAMQGKIPEYVRMSRRPGIGTRYYERNKEKIYENDEVIQRTIHGKVSSFKPPKSFDKKFKEEFPEQWKLIKESRAAAAERDRLLKAELYKGISDLEQLEREAEKVQLKANMLKRTVDFD